MKEHTDKLSSQLSALEEQLIASGGQGVLLTRERTALLNLTTKQLLNKMKDGSVSAVITLEAFQAKVSEKDGGVLAVTTLEEFQAKVSQNDGSMSAVTMLEAFHAKVGLKNQLIKRILNSFI